MQITVEGNELVIRVELDVAGNVSSSGKSLVLASTNGFAALATPFGMAKLGLNVITSDPRWTGGAKAKEPVKPSLVKRGPMMAAVAGK